MSAPDNSAWDAAWARHEHLHDLLDRCDPGLMSKAAYDAVEEDYLDAFRKMRAMPALTVEALAQKILAEVDMDDEARAILAGEHPLAGR